MSFPLSSIAPTSVASTFGPKLGQLEPKFGMLTRVHSATPNRAMNYGQELIQKLSPTENPVQQDGSPLLIMDPTNLADFAHTLGLHTNQDIDPKKAHGFKDPTDEHTFWVVADAADTPPHGTMYANLVNALQSLIAKTSSKMSIDDQVRARQNIQHSLTQQKPTFSIEI